MGIAVRDERFVGNGFIYIVSLLCLGQFTFIHFPHLACAHVEYSVTTKPLQLIHASTEQEYSTEGESPSTDREILSRNARYLLFPEGSSAGILVDLSIPVNGLPLESVFISMNFESNYNLLDNVTQLPQAYIDGNQFSKRRAYDIAEGWLSSIGMNGKICLLRTICETAAKSLVLDSLAAEIINLIFTPSSSASEQLSQDILEAERLGRSLSTWDYDGGRSDVNCTKAYPSCPISPLDLFTLEGGEDGSE
ncbi:uncharacterized protein LOC124167125 [Ischnura elegans]|uniref:uncharacterized protein LOC124167125 n=1 Tax=Ischnura elegans TaxID=197161 RepID=UPI001ED8A44A|nr:uncharacterized protein LOC124167125 [Ischnura elegans]